MYCKIPKTKLSRSGYRQKKYKNIISKYKTEDGITITFHSLLEKKVYLWLKKNEYDFEFQKKILIMETVKKKIHYICDFVVRPKTSDKSIYIDTKSTATITKTFLLKKDIFEGKFDTKLHIAYSVEHVAKILIEEFNNES